MVATFQRRPMAERTRPPWFSREGEPMSPSRILGGVRRRLLLLAIVLVVLAACDGGGGDTSPSSSPQFPFSLSRVRAHDDERDPRGLPRLRSRLPGRAGRFPVHDRFRQRRCGGVAQRRDVPGRQLPREGGGREQGASLPRRDGSRRLPRIPSSWGLSGSRTTSRHYPTAPTSSSARSTCSCMARSASVERVHLSRLSPLCQGERS